MVFSSIPAYLGPHSWLQQANQQQPDDRTTHLLPQPPRPATAPPTEPPPPAIGAGLSTAQATPNTMVERSRLAKIPLPEASLRCPRCDSTNTKFCYFNNYSLSQPRHYCKTCRRYWTRGGALRNVPVGGGCRRNRRSKSNGGSNTRSKSTVVVSTHQQASTSTAHQNFTNPNKTLSLGQISGLTTNLPILPPLQSLGDCNANDIGLDFGGIQVNNPSNNISSVGLVGQWRSSLHQVQQFPNFLINSTGLGQSSNVLYPLMEDGIEGVKHDQTLDYYNRIRSKPLADMTAMGDGNSESLKMEESNQEDGNDLPRNFLGNIDFNSTNNQYSWSADLSGFGSNNSSTGHLL